MRLAKIIAIGGEIERKSKTSAAESGNQQKNQSLAKMAAAIGESENGIVSA